MTDIAQFAAGTTPSVSKSTASAQPVSSPAAAVAASNLPNTSPQKIGPMLVASGKLKSKDLNAILTEQKINGLRFGEAALKLGLVDEADIKAILAEQFAYTKTPGANSYLDRRLTALFQPDSLHAEALRSLRSELLLRYFNNQSQTLALMGCDDADAIAITSANLAISFAQMGIKTLLIDCNLRQPQLQDLFNINPQVPGLADSLAGRAEISPIKIEAVRGLEVICAGTQAPNPQELLANKYAFQAQLDNLSKGFDVVLFNTAPLDTNSDAQLVAAQAGAALLLAKANITRSRTLSKISHRLQELGVRLLGVSLTC